MGSGRNSLNDVSWRALVAELLGTALLVFIGCGSCLASGLAGDNVSGSTLGGLSRTENIIIIAPIALAFGLVIATMVETIGQVSGCHINPAVTVGLCVYGKIKPISAILYIICQTIGAIVGAAFLLLATPNNYAGSLCTPGISGNITVGQGFLVEMLISFLFVLLVCSVCDECKTEGKGRIPLAVGFAITCSHLMAIPYTGSSMNPARATGPMIVSRHWDPHHWVYWVGPLLGGFLAGLLYRYLLCSKVQPSHSCKCCHGNKVNHVDAECALPTTSAPESIEQPKASHASAINSPTTT